MKIIDLTLDIKKEEYTTSIVKIPVSEQTYRGVIHNFTLSSMSGTYIDFPGHIEEFKDGIDAGNCPLEKLFMVDATLIRLERKGKGREISVAELEETGIKVNTGCLIIDTGWEKEHHFDATDIYFYGKDAIRWIASQSIHLFISDVYENHSEPRGIFVEFFKAGISTVCIPINLWKINKEKIKVCVLPLKIPGAVQVPCRLIAIVPEPE
ncbi:MAG: cyclase family protein [Candidatus Ratteibacteria bacterium]|nr:cyclase family protein [Candidatus Ratteibacteria bacterium]